MKITLYAWMINQTQLTLIERIKEAFSKLLEDPTKIEWDTIEIASYGEVIHFEGWGIAFGSTSKIIDKTDGLLVELPELDLLTPIEANKDFREGAFETLQEVASQIKHEDQPKHQEPPVVVYAETLEGHSVSSNGDTDFNITEREIEWAKKIRDLIEGCKIKVTKGNLTIEVE